MIVVEKMKRKKFKSTKGLTLNQKVDVYLSLAIKQGKCRVHSGALSDRGYGRTTYKGKMAKIHRLVWIVKKGPIPKGMFICHKCDNRGCIKLSHLFVGSCLDNVRDCIAKNRFSLGINRAAAKLNPELVRKIREAFAKGRGFAGRCRELGVNRGTARSVARGDTWRYVK